MKTTLTLLIALIVNLTLAQNTNKLLWSDVGVEGGYFKNNEKINISAGFGLPELLNIGLKYQMNQTQIGLSVGTIPNWQTISISGNVYSHFGGISKLSKRHPWYATAGLTYFRDVAEKNVYLNTKIGRDFNITEKIGIALDLGFIFRISHKKIKKKSNRGFDFTGPVLPSVGATLFYRILKYKHHENNIHLPNNGTTVKLCLR